ncbi:MAG: hypothetical protein QOE16_1134 [Microbacteriaceae bacterium]|jgi:hypothetical protein|nr:hypothetical protein [Microbacteriaceae bacterium]
MIALILHGVASAPSARRGVRVLFVAVVVLFVAVAVLFVFVFVTVGVAVPRASPRFARVFSLQFAL